MMTMMMTIMLFVSFSCVLRYMSIRFLQCWKRVFFFLPVTIVLLLFVLFLGCRAKLMSSVPRVALFVFSHLVGSASCALILSQTHSFLRAVCCFALLCLCMPHLAGSCGSDFFSPCPRQSR